MRGVLLCEPKILLYVPKTLLNVPKIVLNVPKLITPERTTPDFNTAFSSSDQVTRVDPELHCKGPAEMRYIPETRFIGSLSNRDLLSG